MTFILTILITILILGFLIFIHELGHFTAAKLVGVEVKEFSIGFGKSIVQKKYKGTLYKIGLFPLGGYVQLEGEEKNTGPNSYRAKPYLAKLAILVAGVFMNTVFAIFFFMISLSITDYQFALPKFDNFAFTNTERVQDFYPITVVDIQEYSTVAQYTDEDELNIVAINGQRFTDFSSFNELFQETLGEEVTIEVLNLENFDTFTQQIILGEDESDIDPITIVAISEESPVRDIISVGDRVVSVNQIIPENPSNFNELIDQFAGNEVTLEILNEANELRTETFVPELQETRIVNGEESKVYLNASLVQFEHGYGVLDDESGRQTFFINYDRNILSGAALAYDLTRYQFVALANIFTEAQETGDFTEASESVGGIAQVGDQVGTVVELEAFVFLIPFTGLISLALATFNILPFPALDGGQVVVVTIEALIRRPIPDPIISAVNLAGFSFLILLGIAVTIKDIVQLGWLDGLT